MMSLRLSISVPLSLKPRAADMGTWNLPPGVTDRMIEDAQGGDHMDTCPCHEDHEDNDKCSCGIVECDCMHRGPKCICDDQEKTADRWGE